MFNVEELEAKGTSNKKVLQLFKFDGAGNVINLQKIGYGDTDLWPMRLAEQIDELLTNGTAGHTYNLNDHIYGKVHDSHDNGN